MSRDDWEEAIARAVVEHTFRARLLRDPAGTLADYGMRSGEVEAVERVHARTLAEFVGDILRIAGIGWGSDFDPYVLERDPAW